MNNKPHVHAMIVAAGHGSRFGATTPKQYLLLQGKTLLQHSVARLARSSHINSCLLVIARDDNIAQTLDFSLPVYYAFGGAERWQSVRAGVEAIIDAGAAADDLILIHDAARPAVPCSDIEQVIEAAMLEPYGAILASPVVDTLKQSQASTIIQSTATNIDIPNTDSRCYIKRTIDRTGIWQAQTPQVFRVDQLHHVLTHVAINNLSITDEASAFEQLNLPISLVEGSRQNVKLTYPDDAILITAILSAQY